MATIVGINVVGSASVVVLATLVVPLPPVEDLGRLRVLNVVAAGCYVAVVVPVAAWAGVRHLRPLREWSTEQRPATDREKRILLQAPLRLFWLQLSCWVIAAGAFGALNVVASGALSALLVGATVAITGSTTAACAYLATELLLRHAAARALADGLPQGQVVPGVATRALLAWALGTGLPLLGLGAIGALHLTGVNEASAGDLAVAITCLCGVGLTVGLLAVTLAARATATPIEGVRRALEDVRRGDFGRQVAVFDGTEIGQLQVGFNVMSLGLAERERIRAAFGAYVDPAVAERVVREGDVLDGVDVEVSILFVDIRGFTSFAEQVGPRDVVATLNRLFGAIVPVIHDQGGRVDKFIGDGLMAVFGAPQRIDGHADRALDAALRIVQLVSAGAAGELEIGVGINSGPVVAGTIGPPERLEFSVIGDTVNVAARTEAETRRTGDSILLTEHTYRLLSSAREELVERGVVALKGKTERIRLYAAGPLVAEPLDV